MEINTLETLAAFGLAKALHFNMDVLQHEIPPLPSNLLFQELTTSRGPLPKIKNSHFLNVTEADYGNCLLSDYDIPMLSRFHLRSFKFNLPYEEMKEYVRDGVFDFGQLMMDALNPHSRDILEELSIGNGECLYNNYRSIDQVMKLLPNLRELSLNFRMENPFVYFTGTYDNLRLLNISLTSMESLYGISKLPNLEVLIMSNVEFENSNDFKEIAMLEKLRYLDLSQNQRDEPEIVQQFLQIRAKFPELKHLDISYTDLNHQQLAELLSLYPSLQTICVYKTTCSNAIVENIEVLSASTLSGALKLLKHFEELNEAIRDVDVMKDIKQMIGLEPNFHPNSGAIEEIALYFLEIIGKYQYSYPPLEDTVVCLETLVKIAEVYKNELSDDAKYKMVTCVLNFRCYHVLDWMILTTGIVELTPNLDMLFVYQRTIDFFAYNHLSTEVETIKMLRALEDMNALVPEQRKNSVRRVPDCLRRLFFFLKTLPEQYAQAPNGVQEMGVLIYRCAKLMLKDSDIAFSLPLLYELVDLADFHGNLMTVKYILIACAELITDHVHFEDIPSIPDSKCVKILLKCLNANMNERVGNLEQTHDILAGISIKILAVLLKEGISRNDEFDFVSYMLHNVDQSLESYYIPQLQYRGSRLELTCRIVENAEDWAEMTVHYLRIFASETKVRNMEMFHVNVSDGEERGLRNVQGKKLRSPTYETQRR